MTDADAASSWRELFTRANAAALITLSLGVALHAFNGFLVATSLPTAVLEIGGVELMSWSFTVYLVMAIVGGAAGARLKQRSGARQAMILPALVFLAGTLLAGFAPTMPVFLVGRALQGLGEGTISALCYALIPALFPSRLVARVFGVEAMVWAVGAFGGPLLAGILTETVSWRAAFFVNVPVVVLFVGLVARVVPAEREGGEARAFPLGRLAGIGFGIMLVAIAAVSGDPSRAAALIAGALALLIGVFVADRRSTARLFPSDAFSFRSTVGAGLWMIVLMPVAQCSTSVYLNISVQHLWGYGPTMAGYFHATMALSWSGSALLVAGIDDGHRRLMLIRTGPVLVAGGILGIIWAMRADAPMAIWPCQVMVGTGFGICWAFLSQAIMEAAREGERDRASAMLPTVLSAGYALGAAVAGLVANANGFSPALEPQAIVQAVTRTFGVGAALGSLAILAGFGVRLIRRPAGPSLASGR